jgi:hypothetical protein
MRVREGRGEPEPRPTMPVPSNTDPSLLHKPVIPRPIEADGRGEREKEGSILGKQSSLSIVRRESSKEDPVSLMSEMLNESL